MTLVNVVSMSFGFNFLLLSLLLWMIIKYNWKLVRQQKKTVKLLWVIDLQFLQLKQIPERNLNLSSVFNLVDTRAAQKALSWNNLTFSLCSIWNTGYSSLLKIP